MKRFLFSLFKNRALFRRPASRPSLVRGAAGRTLSLLLAAGSLPAAAAPAKPSAPPDEERPPLKMPFRDDLFEREGDLLQKLNQLLPSLAAHPAAPLMAQKSASALAKIKDRQGYGSGFIVRHEQTEAPILVTAAHAVRDSEPSNLEFFDSRGRRLKPLRVWSFSLPHDLALFELESYEGKTLKPADSPLSGGERLYMLGFPNGLQRMIKGRAVFDPSLPFFAFIADYEFLSEVHGLPRSLERRILQGKLPGGMKGASGGPLVNLYGELTGIILTQDSSNHLLRAARAEILKKLLAHGPLTDFPSPFVLQKEIFHKDSSPESRLESVRELPSAAELPFKDQVLWLQTLLKTKGQALRHPMEKKGMLSNKSLPQLRRQAEKGSASAMFLLGALLAAGPDVPRYIGGDGLLEDREEAVYWFRRAARHGHIDAQFRLAIMLQEGDGVLEDRRKAFRWLRKAAAERHAEAQFHIAEAFDKGAGAAQNKKKAAQWLKKSAAQGHFPSQFRLAEMLDKGDGIRQNKKKAAEWYRLAAESDLKNLGQPLCWAGAFSCPWGLLEREMELLFDQARAQFRLGEMLLAGEAVPQNKGEAAYWLRLAAEGDVFSSMGWVGALEDMAEEERIKLLARGAESLEGMAEDMRPGAKGLPEESELRQISAEGSLSAEAENPAGAFAGKAVPAKTRLKGPEGAFECRASFASLIKGAPSQTTSQTAPKKPGRH